MLLSQLFLRNGRLPTRRASKASLCMTIPRRLSSRYLRNCWKPFARPDCSTRTTFTSTSWITGPRTMQDDVYLLVQEGWQAVLDGKPNTDLIPQPLIVKRYFAKEQAVIEKLEADRDEIIRQIEELGEEHGGEGGLLADAKTDKGKLTKASVKAQLAELKGDRDAADERKMLENYQTLIEKEAAIGKRVKDAQKALEVQV